MDISSDTKVTNLIKNFKNSLNSGIRSDDSVRLDSAIWYLSATANYTYGDASFETEKTWTDEWDFTLNVSNNKISLSEIFNQYNDLIDELRQHYQNKDEVIKQLISISVKTTNVNETNVFCRASALFGFGGPTPISCSFDNSTSYSFWYYHHYNALCEGQSTILTDAAEETQKRIMMCKGVPTGNYYYEEIPPIKIDDPTLYPISPNIPKNNYHYAHLYWNSSEYSNFNSCLIPEDLNFYLNATKNLIYTEENLFHTGIRPVGTSLIGIDMYGAIEELGSYTIYKHKAIVRYGYLRFRPDPKEFL